jgi:hypothetical protein
MKIQHFHSKLSYDLSAMKFRRPRYQDVTGARFGRLTVMWPAGQGKNYQIFLMCSCECGIYLPVLKRSLRSGNTTSCGCFKLQLLSDAKLARTHGMSQSKAYLSYARAKDRCLNHHDHAFKDYGGRGIKFLFTDFRQFFSELGARPAGLTLDRINNDGNYEPGNVRWATKKEQSNNRRPRSRAA